MLETPKYQKFTEAWEDIFKGTKNYPLWSSMAIKEIKRRYRRTLLGPFWTTLSLSLYITATGILFSFLWKTDLKNFLPYFSSGYICWVLFSTIITESCYAFIAADNLLKQINIPYSTFAWLVVFRNILILGHHIIFYTLIIIIMKVPINLNIILFIPGIILIAIAGFAIALIMGLTCARYRDILPVINIFLQISMFITPILWNPSQMTGIRSMIFVNLNPLHHYINIVRAPLLGDSPNLINWIITLIITFILTTIAFWIFANHKRKLIFWI